MKKLVNEYKTIFLEKQDKPGNFPKTFVVHWIFLWTCVEVCQKPKSDLQSHWVLVQPRKLPNLTKKTQTIFWQTKANIETFQKVFLISTFPLNMIFIIKSGKLWTLLKRFPRSNRPDVFLGKGVLKICSKFTGKHSSRSAISIKLQSNFTELALQHECSPVNLLYIFRASFPKNTSGRLLCILKFPIILLRSISKVCSGSSEPWNTGSTLEIA